MISGINGELLNLRQEDDSYSRRPFASIKDVDKLLAIPDKEFLKYTPEQRSNLVVRFSAVTYPTLTNKLHCSLLQTNASASTNRPAKQ